MANSNAPALADIGLNIVGTEGPDELHGGSDEDYILGGAGNDLLHGHSGRDTLIGGHGEDSLYGGQGNDKLLGEYGDDYLDGGGGADVMRGGMGSDMYIVDNVGDVVIEVGNSWDSIRSTVSFTMSERVEYLDLVGGDIDGTGNDDYNEIFGSDGNNHISGAGGDDYLVGKDGNDTIDGGSGRDYIMSGKGNSVLNGGANSDTYDVNGSATIFEATGEGNSDYVNISDYGKVPNTITLIGEIEEIHYSGHGTTLVATDTDNYISYYTDRDSAGSVYGLGGNDYINVIGASLADGGAGNDTIVGMYYEIQLFGGDGDDVLMSTHNSSELTGGTGSDLFVLRWWGEDPDTVLDFSADEDWIFVDAVDYLDDGSLDPNHFYVGVGAGAVAQDGDDYLIFDQASGALYYDWDGNGTVGEQIHVANINVVQGQLSAGNFVVSPDV